ncbi:glycoside hydrolase family 25 protein [Qipengyuania sp. JC766]|uniref:glycoside hydrolase family 25 protein n=1 Tax=Qipengyuania sp. JC766 TaxID=3232139 RepID=UPI003458B254
MGRKARPRKWLWRSLAALVLACAIGAGWLWWSVQHWTPDEGTYPEQGIHARGSDGAIDFVAAHALGADFAYIDASDGGDGRVPRFGARLEAAREAGIPAGAVHLFDPCLRADPQSANFVTVVPRAGDMLPPVIALDVPENACADRVSDAAVESELLTLVNQVEAHTGMHAILKLSPAFEERFGIAGKMDRNLWLTRTRFEPDYVTRPWVLWTANEDLMSEASEEPVEWMVARP